MSTQTSNQPLLAADGRPLKQSLSRALRRQKLRALALVAPLLMFVMLTFVLPIGNMLFRSVENDIVSNIMPYTVNALESWTAEPDTLPDEAIFKAAFYDLSVAAKAKEHTKLGTRLNYEQTGISSTFRKSGRALSKPSKALAKEFDALDSRWQKAETFFELFTTDEAERQDSDRNLLDRQLFRLNQLKGQAYDPLPNFELARDATAALPLTAREYGYWALFTSLEKNKDFTKGKVTEALYVALTDDLQNPQNSELEM